MAVTTRALRPLPTREWQPRQGGQPDLIQIFDQQPHLPEVEPLDYPALFSSFSTELPSDSGDGSLFVGFGLGLFLSLGTSLD